MHCVVDSTIAPPAARLYAVDPVGVHMIRPSPTAQVMQMPSMYTFS